jgi:hypothetical protein
VSEQPDGFVAASVAVARKADVVLSLTGTTMWKAPLPSAAPVPATADEQLSV